MVFLSFTNTFVVLMGLSTVFLGLICIIILCKLVSLFCNLFGSTTTKSNEASSPISSTTKSSNIENRQEMLAAVSAAIAEDLGTDVQAIRIHSVKKL